MWIFTSAAVNIHFILQYMMYICENKEHHGIEKKKSGSQGSFLQHRCDIFIPFCFVFTISLFGGQILFYQIGNMYVPADS